MRFLVSSPRFLDSEAVKQTGTNASAVLAPSPQGRGLGRGLRLLCLPKP
jgi:hypothetical protein